MSISKQIRALLTLRGMKQTDIQGALGMASKQSLSNKFVHERWSAEDLVKIAEACGCELAFLAPDGQVIKVQEEKTGPGA